MCPHYSSDWIDFYFVPFSQQEEVAQAQQRLQTKRDEVENLLVQVQATQSVIQEHVVI